MAKEKKNPVGAPPKKKGEKKVGFSVTCSEKNLKKVKPLVKAYIKQIDV